LKLRLGRAWLKNIWVGNPPLLRVAAAGLLSSARWHHRGIGVIAIQTSDWISRRLTDIS
jgi:hypothetical protein